MKLVMDEKLKHRLVGVSVILSLGAIFLPAMLKKSSQRLEHNFSVNVQLPPKPVAPHVAVTDEEQMFKTIKIAKVELSKPVAEKAIANSNKENTLVATPTKDEVAIPVSKVEPTPQALEKPIQLALNDAANKAAKHEVASVGPIEPVRPVIPVKPVKPISPVKAVAAVAQVKKTPPVVRSKVIAAKATSAAKVNTKQDIYAVQLASFSKLSNAEGLVHKLKQKGYKATYTRVAGTRGVIYKVYVGHSPIKTNVVKLKTQLASAMQLNGFVVNTGVS